MRTNMNGRPRGRMVWITRMMYVTPVAAGVIIGSLGSSLQLGLLVLIAMLLELYLCHIHERTLWTGFLNLWSSFTDAEEPELP